MAARRLRKTSLISSSGDFQQPKLFSQTLMDSRLQDGLHDLDQYRTKKPMSMHREKVLAHAGTRLTRLQGLSDPAEIAQELRRFLKVENERLRIGHRSGANGFWIAQA